MLPRIVKRLMKLETKRLIANIMVGASPCLDLSYYKCACTGVWNDVVCLNKASSIW